MIPQARPLKCRNNTPGHICAQSPPEPVIYPQHEQFVVTLRDLLMTLCKGERDIENVRQELGSVKNFSLGGIFNRIDRDRDGYVESKEIMKFLEENDCDQI